MAIAMKRLTEQRLKALDLSIVKRMMPLQKIRVLHVASQLGFGGTEKAIQVFCQHLNREVFETSVCGIYEGGMRREFLREKGVETYVLNGDFSRFEPLLNKKRVDVIHFYLGWNTEELGAVVNAAKRVGVQVIVETNIFGHYNLEENERFVDRHFLISKSVALEYAARGKISMRQFLEKCRVLYIPVDFDEIEKEAPSQEQIDQFKRRIGVEPDCPLICRVGRSDIRKWSSFPVNMMWFLTRKIPNVKYLIVGGLPRWVHKKISKYHLEKNFIDYGVAFGKELLTIYHAVDLLAHTSRIGESFGCTIAEAMAAGKPVVVDSTPWQDNAQIELVDNGVTGFVTTTPRTYADAVAYLLRHPVQAKRMGQSGYEKAKRAFDAKRIIPLLERYYIELLVSKALNVDKGLVEQYRHFEQFPSSREVLNYPFEYQQRLSNFYGKVGLHERVWFNIKQRTQARPGKVYILKDMYFHIPGT
jgi:glycosyltransferase involved in cell wall biosynthesis